MEKSPSAGDAGVLRDWLLAFSLANISFFDFWHEILFAHPVYVPSWSIFELLTVFAVMAVTAFCFWLMIYWGRTGTLRRFGLQRYLFLYTFGICVYLLWMKASRHTRGVDPAAMNMGIGVCALAGLLAFLRWRRQILKGAELLTLFLFAFLPMTYAQAAWLIINQAEPPPLAKLHSQQKLLHRIVVIVFDELDWQTAFEQRPEGMDLPAFDRLRQESFSAEHTYQGADDTIEAIPSLLTGRSVVSAQEANEVKIEFADGTQADLRNANLFKSLHSAGVNTGVAGWYLSYCPIFSDVVNRCWYDAKVVRPLPEMNLHPALQRLGFLFRIENRRSHRRRYEELLEHSRQLLQDEDLGVVFLHLSVPHIPGIYDAKLHEFSLFQMDEWRGFQDNIVLADQAMAELRSTLESAEQWGQAHVIVTSDHAARPNVLPAGETRAGRVPFFVKLANSTGAGAKLDAPVQNIVIHDLVLALAQGSLTSNDDLRMWLEGHRFDPAATQASEEMGDTASLGR